ncbi:MAG: rRNA maturation RNase YbeY [Desulfobacula sp.]|nr:rRNA maturation RNase YbeY [Desulfobacula sp.]
MGQEKIQINNQQKKKILTATLRQKAKLILNALDYKQHELSILICDDHYIRELNRNYRGVDKATNVLSFPMQEGIPDKEAEDSESYPKLLGDVVISTDTAQKEADEAGITLNERISQLLVHGILHLIGYDHEKSEKDKKDMDDKSLELLEILEPGKELDVF